jgi:hypothetical protein
MTQQPVCWMLLINSRLDGLNKNLNGWDHAYYGYMSNTLCEEMRM